MKRNVLIIMAMLLGAAVLSASEINESNFEENAQDAEITYIEKKVVITENLQGNIFIRDSKVLIQAAVQGDIFLLDSVLTLDDDAVIQGTIYAKNSRLISDDLQLNAQWFVVEEGDSHIDTTISDDDIPVRRIKRTSTYFVSSFLGHLLGWGLFLSLVYLVFYVARRHFFFFENDFHSYWYKYVLLTLPAVLGITVVLVLLSVMCVTILLIPVFIAFLAYTSVSGFAFVISYIGKRLHKMPIDSTPSFLYGAVVFLALQMLELFSDWIGFTPLSILIIIVDSLLFMISFTFGVRYLIHLIHKKRRARLLIVTSNSN